MRKSIVSQAANQASIAPAGEWLDLDSLASLELSSEDPQFPFENALQGGTGAGWRAAHAGPQTIRFKFDRPQSIHRIRLQFREDHVSRSQEFALFATSDTYPRKEVLRQQWTFSPGNSAVENEDYSVDLQGVSMLELEVDPGRHDKQAVAQLQWIAIA